MTRASSADGQANSQLNIIGFRINPDTSGADLYTIFRIGDRDAPLMIGDRILYFPDAAMAPAALELADAEFKSSGPLPEEVELVCDVADTLYLVQNEETDTSATIVNCVNFVLDLVVATSIPIPELYSRILSRLADHMTFERNIASFYATPDVDRSTTINALLWCIGAVTCSSLVLGRDVERGKDEQR